MTKEPEVLQKWRVLEDRPGRPSKFWGTVEAKSRKAAETVAKKQPPWKGKTLRVELHQ